MNVFNYRFVIAFSAGMRDVADRGTLFIRAWSLKVHWNLLKHAVANCIRLGVRIIQIYFKVHVQ